MPVRSARLAAEEGTTGAQEIVYTCPAGVTALVKDIRLSSPVGNVTRAVVAAVSGAVQVSLIDVALGTGVAAVNNCFVVLEPGDQLLLFSTGAVARVWVSGAELSGVAP